MRLLSLVFCLLSSISLAYADVTEDATPIETSKTFGDYEIFFNAIPSMALLPDMAAAYGIERAKDLAYLNITVFKKTGGNSVMRTAALKGTSSDLMTNEPLAFREMREANSISYVAQVRYHNREVLRFDVQIQPQLAAGEVAPVGSPFKISFTRKFYTEQ